MRAPWESFNYELPANLQAHDIIIQFRISYNMANADSGPSGGTP